MSAARKSRPQRPTTAMALKRSGEGKTRRKNHACQGTADADAGR
jgi:hypothetical protein